MSNYNIDYLKGQIKSVEDLKKMVKDCGLNYSIKDIELVYQSLNADPLLNDESLTSVCGGKNLNETNGIRDEMLQRILDRFTKKRK